MKAAYFKSGAEASIYIQPFGWNNLPKIIKNNTLCKLELFVGYKSDETFYLDRNGNSHALRNLTNKFQIMDADKIIKKHKISVYEFSISTDKIKIMSTISGGILINGSEETINEIGIQLRISGTVLTVPHNTLVEFLNNQLKVIGKFSDTDSLLEYLYDEVMEPSSPGYSRSERLF